MARQNRKSASAESLAARRSAADIAAANCDSDGSCENGPQRLKKSKGKAPNPPQVVPDTPDVVEGDSDSESEQIVTSTQVTIHHSPVSEEPEAGRKAASLGDLSRLDETQTSGTLERAVSLDLDASNAKKRKAPPPPSSDDFTNSYEDVGYRKEPRIEDYDTFQRKLKKSSDFGTLEDALQDSDPELDLPIKPVPDLSFIAATNIQEFSSWLEEVRKPKSPEPEMIGHQVTVSLNGESSNDVVTNLDVSALDGNFSTPPETPIKSARVFNSLENEEEAPPPYSQKPVTLEINAPSVSLEVNESSLNVTPPQPSYMFSVNGMNIQESASTVLLISQPNSLEPDFLVEPESDVPPQLPTSPPPVSSPSYITEIRVTESPKQKPVRKDSPEMSKISVRKDSPETSKISVRKDSPEMSNIPVRKDSPEMSKIPVRKDSPEMSKIPVRTMKSETGQRVLQAIQSLAAKELKEGPSVAGFQLKKTPPAVPPRKNDGPSWTEGKERVNGTPHHIPMSGRVSVPVKTSATKIVFESPHQNEEF